MAGLVFKNIKKIYPGNVVAVKDFNLEIQDKEFIVFVGPSGCGKSTTLRMVAGLEEISNGELYIDGVLVNDVTPKDRDIAMVFQNYALYPHMTLYDNMAFSLKLKKMPKDEIDRRVNEAAELLGIKDLLDRKPKALSGGQKQRVALGRAIVRDPKVFLMDEPLSNLDAKLRVQTRTEIIKLHERLQTTIIYVTHDQTEAMTMGDRIVIMKDGLIQQIDSPQNVYEKPINTFVGGFIGSPQMNFIDATIEEENKNIYLSFSDFKIKVSEYKADIIRNKGYLDKKVIMGIRPEHIYDSKIKNDVEISGTINFVEMLGAEKNLFLDVGNDKIVMKVDSDNHMKKDETVKIYLDEDKIHLFDHETELSILYSSESELSTSHN